MDQTTDAAQDVRAIPANEAPWEDVAAVFGSRDESSRCWCQRFRLAPGEQFDAMAAAAVEHARSRGARAVGAYPIITTDAITADLLVGTVSTYAAAGLREVGRPTKRRAVMRLDL